MEFCAVICEYNPFHNGHAYQLAEIKKHCGGKKILCIMSGNFTQRGEIALLDKFTRARHAVENGADVVLELPTAFAVSPAELFAGGALQILNSIPAVKTLAFGCESGSAEEFLHAARATLSEDKQFKAALKENMKDGTSYVKARTKTMLAMNKDIDEALFTSPNNILGTEYCRAILYRKSSIQPMPVARIGGGYADSTPLKNFSSATALRACICKGGKKNAKILKSNLPADVYKSLQDYSAPPFKQALMLALTGADTQKMVNCPDCSEGLENRLRAMAEANPDYDEMLKKAVSKRYTLSRLRRILLQNFLAITGKNVREYSLSPLYCKVLAVKKRNAEEIFATLSEGQFPLITRKSAYASLKKEAASCMQIDLIANKYYCILNKTTMNDYETLFV